MNDQSLGDQINSSRNESNKSRNESSMLGYECSKKRNSGNDTYIRPSPKTEPKAKRFLRNVHGTLNHGLYLVSSSTTSLVAYSDVDWAGCPATQRLTSGYRVFLGNNLLSWFSKRQPFLFRTSAGQA
ncbi:ribonuclease H-like domain-containing protein [Tanacetum coccineum]